MYEEADAAAQKGPKSALQNRLLFHLAHKVGFFPKDVPPLLSHNHRDGQTGRQPRREREREAEKQAGRQTGEEMRAYTRIHTYSINSLSHIPNSISSINSTHSLTLSLTHFLSHYNSLAPPPFQWFCSLGMTSA